MWRFLGVWSKNRWEWVASILACMHYKITTVGFFEAMGQGIVDYIFNQTEMTTVLCAGAYVKKITDMKKANLAGGVHNLIIIDDVDKDVIADADANGLKIYTFKDVLEASKGDAANIPFDEPVPDDAYIISYTSGTTGDSKGVKLTHKNLLTNAVATTATLRMVGVGSGDTYISYLPMTHSFEQACMGSALVQKLGIGFYQGDPLKLTDDC